MWKNCQSENCSEIREMSEKNIQNIMEKWWKFQGTVQKSVFLTSNVN